MADLHLPITLVESPAVDLGGFPIAFERSYRLSDSIFGVIFAVHLEFAGTPVTVEETSFFKGPNDGGPRRRASIKIPIGPATLPRMQEIVTVTRDSSLVDGSPRLIEVNWSCVGYTTLETAKDFRDAMKIAFDLGLVFARGETFFPAMETGDSK